MRRAGLLVLLVGGAAAGEPCRVGVDVGAGALRYKCLPALSADQARIAVTEIDPDGGRGYPNLVVSLLPSSPSAHAGDGDIKPLERFPVLAPRDVDEFAGQINADVQKRIQPRLDKLNAALDKGGFAALAALPGVPDVDGQEFTITAGELTIRYHKNRWIEVRKGEALWGKLRLMQVKKGSADGECVHAPRVGSLHMSADQTLLVVRVRYTGNDTCGDPAERWRLVHIAPVAPPRK